MVELDSTTTFEPKQLMDETDEMTQTTEVQEVEE